MPVRAGRVSQVPEAYEHQARVCRGVWGFGVLGVAAFVGFWALGFMVLGL